MRPAAKIPTQRPKPPPEKSEKAATSSMTPRIRVTQPQVCRPLMMYVAFAVKNFESPIAAMP